MSDFFQSAIGHLVTAYITVIIVLNVIKTFLFFLSKNGIAIFTENNTFNLTAPFAQPYIENGILHLVVYFQGRGSLFFNQLTGFLLFPKSKLSYSDRYEIVLKKDRWNFYPVQIFPVIGNGIAAKSSEYDGVIVIWQFGNSLQKLLESNGYRINPEDNVLSEKLKLDYGRPQSARLSWLGDFKKELQTLSSL